MPFVRRRPESRLNEERAKLLQAIDDMPWCWIATNLRGFIVDANAAAHSLLGSTSLFDRALITFVVRRDTRAFRRILGELATGKRDEVRCDDLAVRPRGGKAVRSTADGKVVYGVDGTPVALRWILRAKSADGTSTRDLTATVAVQTIRPVESEVVGPLGPSE
jgi:PAS domain-containing protein